MENCRWCKVCGDRYVSNKCPSCEAKKKAEKKKK